MSIKIKTGWLSDKNGDRFAPKTLTTQVQTPGGVLLDDAIEAALTDLGDTLREELEVIVDEELSSTSDNPVQNKVIDAEFENVTSSINELNSRILSIGQTTGIGKVYYVDTMDKVTNNSFGMRCLIYVTNKGDSDVDVEYPAWIILNGTQNYGRFTGQLIDIRGNRYYCEVSGSVTLGKLNTKGMPTPEESDANKYLRGDMTWEEIDISSKADIEHNHDDRYYTETEVNSLLGGKADSAHNHDSVYEAKGAASSALSEAKEYADGKVSSLASVSYVGTSLSSHDVSSSAHNDIRDLISGLTSRLNSIADSDDETLDQLSEIVSYIKSNRDLISSITTSKVSVADIIDNLTTNVTTKPLSAAQGVAIKSLIDALSVVVDGKAATSHAHAISEVSGLQASLDGKAENGHGHTIADVDGLRDELDGLDTRFDEVSEVTTENASNIKRLAEINSECIFKGSDYDWITGYFDVSGHFNGAYYYRVCVKQWFPVEPGAEYHFKTNSTNSEDRFLIRGYNGTTGYNIIGTLVSLQSDITITIPDNVTYITITLSRSEDNGDSGTMISSLLADLASGATNPTVTKLYAVNAYSKTEIDERIDAISGEFDSLGETLGGYAEKILENSTKINEAEDAISGKAQVQIIEWEDEG